ncbi:MAG: hypothetical protein OEX07_13655, partial [Gammaproteobacteria bacterium]|nr:hypothetical protein [Gammaproteobacteria bacterium]
MNVVNEMVSDLNTNKSALRGTKRRQKKSKEKTVISWQASSTLILLIGISALSYAIWFFNQQQTIPPMVSIAKFNKQEILNPERPGSHEQVGSPEQIGSHEQIETHKKQMPVTPKAQAITSINSSHGLAEAKPNTPAPEKTEIAHVAKSNSTPKKAAENNLVAKIEHRKPEKTSETTTKRTSVILSTSKPAKEKSEPLKKSTQEPENIVRTNTKKKTEEIAKQIVTSPKTLKTQTGNQKITTQNKPEKPAKANNTEAVAKNDEFDKQSIKFSNVQAAKKHYAEALARLNSGDTNSAIALFEKTLSLKNTHVDARKSLAGIYINNRQLAEA